MSLPPLRRAKIVCTIGPSSQDQVGALISAGMNVARLNFSHGSHEDHTRVFQAIRSESSARDLAVAVLADLQGPKIRVGKIPRRASSSRSTKSSSSASTPRPRSSRAAWRSTTRTWPAR
ncbi:pyruvate kinase [Nannocystis pusilla]|uniref:pyruvate kinase n=1 Tax=Nannocystis pusilla TaxID=889268 RepID=UPI003B76BC7C